MVGQNGRLAAACGHSLQAIRSCRTRCSHPRPNSHRVACRQCGRSTVAGPPAIATFRISVPAWNPTQRPSGEMKGNRAVDGSRQGARLELVHAAHRERRLRLPGSAGTIDDERAIGRDRHIAIVALDDQRLRRRRREDEAHRRDGVAAAETMPARSWLSTMAPSANPTAIAATAVARRERGERDRRGAARGAIVSLIRNRATLMSGIRALAIFLEAAPQQQSNLRRRVGRQRVPVRFAAHDRGDRVGDVFAVERAACRSAFRRARSRTPTRRCACRRRGPSPARDSCRRRCRESGPPASSPACVIVGELASAADSRRAGCRIQGLRETEVQHLDGAVVGDLDVGGFQIAMDDAALVRRFERIGDLPRDGDRFVERRSVPARCDRRASRPSTNSITRNGPLSPSSRP